MHNPREMSQFLEANAPLHNVGGRLAPVEQFVRTELRGVKDGDVSIEAARIVAQALAGARIDQQVDLIMAEAEEA